MTGICVDLETRQTVDLLSDRTASTLSDQEHPTPLIFAAQEGHFEIVRKLVEAGANPNLIPDPYLDKGDPPLWFATTSEIANKIWCWYKYLRIMEKRL
ncbi:MAG: ankyrin repeat domain-containing protein [Xenococcus sp. (in: cyanobacteria)]